MVRCRTCDRKDLGDISEIKDLGDISKILASNTGLLGSSYPVISVKF